MALSTISLVRKPMLIYFSFGNTQAISTIDRLMRPQCAIVFASAIVLAVADVSATINAKPIQTGDVPIKRLLRSETSVDVDGEERGYELKGLKLGEETLTIPGPAKAAADAAAAAAAAKYAATGADLLNEIKTQWEIMIKHFGLEKFLQTHYLKPHEKLLEYNNHHDGTYQMSLVRGIVGDDNEILKAIHGLDNDRTGFIVKILQKNLYAEWIRSKKDLDSVKKDVQKLKNDRVELRPNEKGKGWIEQYEETVQSKINGLSKQLVELQKEETTLIDKVKKRKVSKTNSIEELETYNEFYVNLNEEFRLIRTKINELTDEQTRLEALITSPP